MSTASPLARALDHTEFAREAVIEAIFLSVETAVEGVVPDPDGSDVVERVGEIFDRLGIHTAVHGGGYPLAEELYDNRVMIRALESGADPRWYVDIFYGDDETLRRELIERATNDWQYTIKHIIIR